MCPLVGGQEETDKDTQQQYTPQSVALMLLKETPAAVSFVFSLLLLCSGAAAAQLPPGSHAKPQKP